MVDRVRVIVFVGLAACGRLGFEQTGVGAMDAPAGGPGSTDGGGLVCPSTCGPSGTASCCASAAIPGGTFHRSYDVAVDGMFPSMAYPATIDAVRLDIYEVTVGRFRQWVDAGMGTIANPPPDGAGARTLNGMLGQAGWEPGWNGESYILMYDSAELRRNIGRCGWATWTDEPGPNENKPMTCVTWFQAFAFCAWDGGFLPTEAEWTFAASGGSEQRAYPWSSPASSTAIDCTRANHSPVYPTFCVDALTEVGRHSPLGDGRWGHADLAGNVSEWTVEAADPLPLTPCANCSRLVAQGYSFATSTRLALGGNFHSEPPTLRAGWRDSLANPVSAQAEVGFRCARPDP